MSERVLGIIVKAINKATSREMGDLCGTASKTGHHSIMWHEADAVLAALQANGLIREELIREEEEW